MTRSGPGCRRRGNDSWPSSARRAAIRRSRPGRPARSSRRSSRPTGAPTWPPLRRARHPRRSACAGPTTCRSVGFVRRAPPHSGFRNGHRAARPRPMRTAASCRGLIAGMTGMADISAGGGLRLTSLGRRLRRVGRPSTVLWTGRSTRSGRPDGRRELPAVGRRRCGARRNPDRHWPGTVAAGVTGRGRTPPAVSRPSRLRSRSPARDATSRPASGMTLPGSRCSRAGRGLTGRVRAARVRTGRAGTGHLQAVVGERGLVPPGPRR